MNSLQRILLAAFLLAALPVVAHAQFGFGLGVAAVGDNVRQAGGELADLIRKDSIGYNDVAGTFGFYATGRIKYPVGPIRIIGDVSYIFFPAEEVTLTDYNVNTDQTGSATFEVGASYIPLNAGIEFALPIPVVRPYLGAEFSYTLISRTMTLVKADATGTVSPDVANKSAGENEAGLAIGAGAELAVGPVALDLGARFNMTNLFTKDTDIEKSINFLQVGATLYFGNLMSSDGDDD
jgi:hypothetical protein